MAKKKGRLSSDQMIAKLPKPEKGYKIHYDGSVPGFGVRVTSSGAKSFVLNYRVRGTGTERRYTIGAISHWKLSRARTEAENLRCIVDLGGDPVQDHKDKREQAAEEKRRSKTVDELCDRFEVEHLPTLRPATQKFYMLALRNHIRPAIGKKRVESVTKEDIEAMRDGLTALGQRHQSNQCVTLAGVLFNHAIKWEWRTGKNPAADVAKHSLEGRERYLTTSETKRLSAAVEGLKDRQAATIIRILQLTGSRVGEVLSMRWQDIDLEREIWRKPAMLTKQGRVHRLPLTGPVLSILKALNKEQDEAHSRLAADLATKGRREPERSPWVFPGRGRAGHRTDLRLPWETVLKEAKIDDLRIHDLRHSLASTLVTAGYSLHLIGHVLGHSRPETTAKYAHVDDDPVREAMMKAARLIDALSTADSKPEDKE